MEHRADRGRARLEASPSSVLGGGSDVIQAVIASLHVDQPRDVRQIAGVDGELARLTDSPVVELNRAVAIAEVDGPEAGLRLIDRLELRGPPIPALIVRASCCTASGRFDEALDADRRAVLLVHQEGRVPVVRTAIVGDRGRQAPPGAGPWSEQ